VIFGEIGRKCLTSDRHADDDLPEKSDACFDDDDDYDALHSSDDDDDD
jgi:hypothetical protein